MENLKLNNAKVLEFYVKEPEHSITKNNFNINDINIEYNAEFLVNPEHKRFACILQITYLYNIKKEKNIFLNSRMFFEFIAQNLNEDKILKGDLPENFLEIIFSISYNTARGILISKTSDTLFNSIYLPIADPKEALKKIIKEINPTTKSNKSKKK